MLGPMARTLFPRRAQRSRTPADALTRREAIKASLAAAAGVLLSHAGLAGCAPSATARRPGAPIAPARRIVIIGAGFGGLACAYELRSAGYDVTVLEARGRI